MLTPHTVTCEDKTGEGAYGPVLAAPRTIERCQVTEQIRTVRDGDGAETVSSATVMVRPEYGRIPAGSLITLPSGRKAAVITTQHHNIRPLPEFYELALT